MYLFFLNRDATKIIFYTVLKFTAYVVSVTELCMYVLYLCTTFQQKARYIVDLKGFQHLNLVNIETGAIF